MTCKFLPWKLPSHKPGTKRVVIDARVVVTSQGHGIARYAEELLAELCRTYRGPADGETELEFVLLVCKSSPLFKWKMPPEVQLVALYTRWIAFLGQVELALLLPLLKPDLFHSPSFVVPFLTSVPLLTTIHDLNHVVLSENYSLFHRVYYSFFLANKIKKARSVITVSNFSRDEIVKFFQVKTETVKVIYNGISESFRGRAKQRNDHELQDFRRRYELPSEFILSAGNRKPHKNMRRLVEAWCEINTSIPLVLLMEFDADLSYLAQSYKKKHLLYFLRYVPTNELHNVYTLAKLFVFPSLYEGFGFPPLEAAACGVPVLASNKTCLPEVLGTSAKFVDPEDLEALKDGIEWSLKQEPQAQSALRNEEGLKVLERFDWSVTLRETLKLYRTVLQ